MNKTFLAFIIIFLFFVTGCSVTISSTGPIPVAGNTFTITSCKAEPQILQVKENDEITFNNNDDQQHTIFIDSQELMLPAKGSLKITAKNTASLPKPFTNNYLCDQSWSGAIYISS